MEVIRAYNAIKIYDKQLSVYRYLYEWERIYGLAISLKLPDVMEERPLYDFALTLDKIDSSYATNLELRIDENVRQRVQNVSVKLIQLEDIIEEFRHYYDRHQASRNDRIIPGSFATTHNGIKPEQKSCICGYNHLFKECFYLNSNLRPSGWTGKESIYNKIDNALADPKRVKIKTLIENTCDYKGSKENNMTNGKVTPEKQLMVNAILGEQETEELQSSFRGNSLNYAALAATDSINKLRNSWILDGGSDVHICNNAEKWGFKEVKKADKRNFVRAGSSSVPIEAFGTVRVKVDTPAGTKHITLENVILCRQFLTNIVSMQLINKLGLHWNSRIPNQLEWEDHSLACLLYKNGGRVFFNNSNAEMDKKSTLR